MEKRKVLFVDDEINVLNSLRRGLMGESYICLFAESGKEALELLEKHKVAVIVTDMRMHDMNGLELLKITKERYPNTVRIVLSGYTQLPQVLATINQGDIFRFITKPWKVEDEFKPIIREAIEYYELIVGKEEFSKILEKQNTSIQNILKIMDEKLTNNKKEFFYVKNLVDGIFEFILTEIIKSDISKADFELRFYIVKSFFLGFLNTFPTDNKNFKLYEMLNEIENNISKLSNFKKVLINNINDKDIACYGNFQLIFYIMIFTLKYLPNKNGSNQLKIDLYLKRDDNNLITEIVTSINSLNNEPTCKLNNSDIIFIEKLINHSIKNFNMDIQIHYSDEKVILQYNISFLLKKQNLPNS